jgi:hypothetical protein
MFANQGAGDANAKKQPCAVQMRNGDWDFVTFIHPNHKSFREFINEPTLFVEVLDGEGAKMFVQKSEFLRIEPDMRDKEKSASAPKHVKFDLGRYDADDPAIVLGVPRGAPEDVIRAAYHDQARKLHPDRLASIDVPQEVIALAGLLLAKVNTAYRSMMDATRTKEAA